MDLQAELGAIAGAHGGTGEPSLHPTRTDVVVLRRGEVVVKAHSRRDDAEALRLRVRAAASAALSGLLLPPLRPDVLTVADRAVTVWPAGTPVSHDELDAAPWCWSRAGGPRLRGPARSSRSSPGWARASGWR
ncbi:aminoglycoside phosphotransferase family protein, partial [Nonomuraea sp. NPDC050405]